MMKLVTVVIPTYNAEKYLRETLESIYNQIVDFDYDVFVANDCSTDKTIDICKEYSVNKSNFSFHTHNENVGMSKNQDFALKASSTKYTAYIDSDDVYLDKFYLQKQLDLLMSDDNLSMVFSNVKRFNLDLGKESLKYTGYKPPAMFDVHTYLQNGGISIPNSSIVVKTSISHKIPSIFSSFFQYDFLCHIFRGLHGKYGYNDFVGVGYRLHSQQATNIKNAEWKLKDSIRLCYQMHEFFPPEISRYFSIPQYELNQLSFVYLYERSFLKFSIYYFKWLFADRFKNFNLRDQFWFFKRAIKRKSF